MLPPLRKLEEENPLRKPDEGDPPRAIDPPLREPPCICPEEGVASDAANSATMAHWCRIRRIIALPEAGFVKSLAPPFAVILSLARTSHCEVVVESTDNLI